MRSWGSCVIFLDSSFALCNVWWYKQNWKKDGGRPMFKYKTTNDTGCIDSILMIRIRISDPIILRRPRGDSWVFLKKFVADFPDPTHHPSVSEDEITRNKAQQRSQQTVAQRGLIIVSFDTS